MRPWARLPRPNGPGLTAEGQTLHPPRDMSRVAQGLGPRTHACFPMRGKVTVFPKPPPPCKVKDVQWLLVFVARCHPLIVNC